MKALQIVAPENAVWMDAPDPEPGPGQVLTQVTRVTTCPQWDLHIFHGKPMFDPKVPVPYPYTLGQPGHEMTGRVVAVGDGVTELKPGDRVAAWRDQGHHRGGCYAELVVHEADNLLRAPENLTPEAVASLELAMCVSTAMLQMKRLTTVEGKRCGVLGLGPAGLVAAQLLRAEGAAEVIGFDLNAWRCEYAAGIVDQAVRVGSDAEQTWPRRRQSGAIAVMVECVGYPDSVRLAMDLTTETVALFGVQRHDYVYAQNHTGLCLLGYPGHHRVGAEYALGLITAGKLDLTRLITHHFTFDRYAEAVATLASQEAIKVCFDL